MKRETWFNIGFAILLIVIGILVWYQASNMPVPEPPR